MIKYLNATLECTIEPRISEAESLKCVRFFNTARKAGGFDASIKKICGAENKTFNKTFFSCSKSTSDRVPYYYKKWKYTPAVRSKISSKLIFASCVWYSDRGHYELCVFIKDIGRRLPLQLQCSYQGQQGDFSQSVRWNYKTRFWGGQNMYYQNTPNSRDPPRSRHDVMLHKGCSHDARVRDVSTWSSFSFLPTMISTVVFLCKC